MLRTTALLSPIQTLYPNSHITWICGAGSFPFIRETPAIDRALEFNSESLLILSTLAFDVCINFDLSIEACALCESVSAPNKFGFGLTSSGAVAPFSSAAEAVYEMSLWDDVKRANQKTYQQLMADLIGADSRPSEIQLHIPQSSQESASIFFDQQLVERGKPVIGFNVGAGDRWQHKKWTAEGYTTLARSVVRDLGAQVMILYGPDDNEQAQAVMASLDVPYIDAGLWPSILDFCAVMNLCDAVVTGDTFALHAALALKKKVVCLVGPTSAAELDLYGRGEILQGEIDCLGCYLTRCDKDPYCMKLLEADTVFEAVKTQMEQA